MATERLDVIADARPRAAAREWWLFSPRVDVCVFLGSALASLLLLWVGARAGVLEADSPDWAWVPAVLLVDVAHVYATAFRVYFDAEELKRRAALYVLAPLIAYALGWRSTRKARRSSGALWPIWPSSISCGSSTAGSRSTARAAASAGARGGGWTRR